MSAIQNVGVTPRQVFSMFIPVTVEAGMKAPLLAPLVDRREVGAIAGEGTVCFRVLQEGRFGGHVFEVGDLVLCAGAPRHEDAVVLVARGHGRPRLGRVVGPHLLGDAGERCHEARWRAAGRVVGVARQRQGRWVISTWGGGEAPVAAPRVEARARSWASALSKPAASVGARASTSAARAYAPAPRSAPRREADRQLSLFGAVA